ncbi:unnamed protein product [Larinioides sclopetarius]|uniref:Uncharacterized protein n=1 Tax=Larinioides sclopetarius TaxID=280406 RepID=A0AAV1ZUF5_9ARAC
MCILFGYTLGTLKISVQFVNGLSYSQDSEMVAGPFGVYPSDLCQRLAKRKFDSYTWKI